MLKETKLPFGNNQYIFIILFIATLSFIYKLVLVNFFTNFHLVDDAYISLRYATNFIEHGQFVYNLDEFVFGVSTPLYSFLLVLLKFLFYNNVEPAILIFGFTFWFLSSFLIVYILKRNGYDQLTVLVIITLFNFYPIFIDNQMLGMETPLFIFILLCIVSSIISCSSVYVTSTLVALLILARPEGFLFVPGFVYLHLSITSNSKFDLGLLFKSSLLTAFIVSCWLLFSYLYFNSIIPQSVISKSGWNSSFYDSQYLGPFSYFIYIIPRLILFPFIDSLPAFSPFFSISAFFIIFVSSAFAIKSKSSVIASFSISLILYILFYTVGKGAVEASWYSIPSSVLFLLMSAPLISYIVSSIKFKIPIFSFIFLLIFSLSLYFVDVRSQLLNYYFKHYATLSVKLNSLKEVKSVMLGEIGVFGYFSGLHIIDVASLVSPDVLYLRNQSTSFLDLVSKINPDSLLVSTSSVRDNTHPMLGYFGTDAEYIWFHSNYSLLFCSSDKSLFVRVF